MKKKKTPEPYINRIRKISSISITFVDFCLFNRIERKNKIAKQKTMS